MLTTKQIKKACDWFVFSFLIMPPFLTCVVVWGITDDIKRKYFSK